MTTETFQWSDAFLLGYGKMDDTHREFVELVAAMLTCPDPEMAERLHAFAAHAEHHFAEELNWMLTSQFPATQCHADEHAAVMGSVRQVQELVDAGNIEVARRLATELARWFPSHADHMDSALAQWLVRKKHGGAPLVLKRGIKQQADTVG
ncbi:MAG TPA: hemerythrin domain-containing protein [Steroidobacteraceae bacterium]|nr:hemerythrin domain-containing protein [Steroidobacteraceae bacterium]